MKQHKGFLIIIAGPSGVGKGSIVKSLLPDKNLKLNFSISATTRKKRDGEVEGVNYFYKTKEEFEQMIANNELLEHATYVNNYYGTPMFYVNEVLNKGENLLLEIECQGVAQVIKKIPETLTIFIKPPSMEELKDRLIKRGSENLHLIEDRIKQAEFEMSQIHLFKHVVVNDDLLKATEEVRQIILKAMHHGN
ncbi:guanylate kinase [[Mycoplasma] testudinis]|uniref:guanylate kinase n=1 Tax=[Mycoplasma] testudinis TaxID=33924 RepID=UPI0004814BEF|nr:guanylate kinase [[Mycoplasma] testudinis]